jgi:hypothetical protein
MLHYVGPCAQSEIYNGWVKAREFTGILLAREFAILRFCREEINGRNRVAKAVGRAASPLKQ